MNDPWADAGSTPALSDDADEGASSEAPAPDARYGPGTLVGQGGMGRVESVTDRALGRVVARKSPVQASPDRIARLEREARITARLDHPGIVPVFDLGSGPTGLPWYTMRLIRGRGLDAVLAEATTLPERLRLVPRVLATAQAVASAHAQGIVHRDLKPANVMVGPFGETLVVDWGLARVLDEDDDLPVGADAAESPDLTRVGAVVGTPRWMSPEQAAGQPADRRSDVYALGRILGLVVGEEQPEIATPRDLAAVVHKAIADDPDDRYQDAGALAAYEAALPGYEVLGFLSSGPTWPELWVSHDALHCRTKELFDEGMLYVQHVPRLEGPGSALGFEVRADGFTIWSAPWTLADQHLAGGPVTVRIEVLARRITAPARPVPVLLSVRRPSIEPGAPVS